MKKLWKVDKIKTQSHWLQLEDATGDLYSAFIKWDGCCEISRCDSNDHEDNIHMCDIDEWIDRLQSMKKAALKHFGDDWPI